MTTTPDSLIPRPAASTGETIKTLGGFDSPPPVSPPASLGHWEMELVEAVMDCASWRGQDADRFFSVDEPNLGQINTTMSAQTAWASELPRFIRGIGRPGTDGSVLRDADGQPILQQVDHIRATEWFSRLSVKAQLMAVGLWVEVFLPQADEGNAARSRRRRRG